jgi:hypothetical protein
VTFGFKALLTRVPFLLNLLPQGLQRYYTNSLIEEKLVPDHWWRRSDSSTGSQDEFGKVKKLVRKTYLDTIEKSNLKPFIDNNKLAPYNKDPKKPLHILAVLPLIETLLFVALIIFVYNMWSVQVDFYGELSPIDRKFIL